MSDKEVFEGRMGLNTASKVAKEDRQALRAQLQEQYESRTPEMQLEDALFHLKLEIQTTLNQAEEQEIPKVGTYIEQGMQLYKSIVKVSKKQLAEIWGQKDSNLRKYITGERLLPIDLARKIAISFNLPQDLLWRIKLANLKTEFDQLETKESTEQYTLASILKQSA